MLRISQIFSTCTLVYLLLIPVNGLCTNQGSNPSLTQSDKLTSTKISILANHVIGRGDDEQREFAILTLSLLKDAYSEVLYNSSQFRPHTAAERRKQITWGWATSQMIASLNHYLRRLEHNAAFALHVDHLQRTLIIIDGHVVEITGPRVRSQSRFQQRIVEFFCLTRDCSWLEPEEPEKSEEEIAIQRSLSGGSWLFRQDHTPAYVIGGLIYFKFSNSNDRDRKAVLSRALVDEIASLVLMIKQLNVNEEPIAWSSILNSQPDVSSPKLKLVNGNEKSQVTISLLSQLHQSDWHRLISWLRDKGIDRGKKLELRYLESLKMADKLS